MPRNTNPEFVREALDLHQQLPFWQRATRRAVGQYPDRESRELLRRSELGPAGRIIENAVGAVRTTQRLNHTPIAEFNGKWIVADLTGESDKASLPATIERGSDTAKTIERLFGRGDRKSTATGLDELGFFVERYSKWERTQDIAASNDRLGLVAFHDSNAVDAIQLSREDMAALDQPAQEALEHLAAAADQAAMIEYLYAKPDHAA
jgi:hypothetical protein